MSSSNPQEAAQELSRTIGVVLGALAILAFQGWVLLVVIGWLGLPITISLFQSIVICALISSLVK